VHARSLQYTNASQIPDAGGAQIRLNLWLLSGHTTTADGQPKEVTIHRVEHSPNTTTTPVTVLSGGGAIVPLYSYPCCGSVESCWNPIAATAASVITLVVMNPGNGDSNQCPPNSDWAFVRDLMTSSGAKTLG
jgi:hypothetical protein